MLGVGWTEMLVIGLVALIVIGPKDLPMMMQKLGRFTATVRRMGSDFQREINKTTGLDEVKNLRNAITQPLKQTTDAIRKEFNTVTASGTVEPSGVLKPADPKAESVVDEIRAAAGMTPAESIKAAVTKATAAAPAVAAAEPVKAAAAPVKPRRVTRAKAIPTAKVETAELPPVKRAPRRAAAKPVAAPAGKPVESPAPLEALPPAATPANKKAARPRTAGGVNKSAAKKA